MSHTLRATSRRMPVGWSRPCAPDGASGLTLTAPVSARIPCQQAFSQGYHRLPFHVQFSLQACEVTIDRRHGEDAAPALVFQQAIPGRDVAVDRNLVPLLGMTDIIDRHVVVLAPEKRYRIECRALSQHIARGGLSLTFGNHPVFDPDVFARMRIGQARDPSAVAPARPRGPRYRARAMPLRPPGR